MTDILVIDISEFDRLRIQVQPDGALKEKYEGLYNKYECFQKTAVGYQRGGDSKPSPHVPHKQFPRREVQRERVLQRNKPLNKQLLGLLNVLNENNYAKILSKLRMLVTKENVKTVTATMLDQCCTQAFYLKMYMRLFQDVAALSGYAQQMKEVMQEFAASLTEEEHIYKNPRAFADYDLFCGQQKHKVWVMSKNALVAELYKRQLLAMDMNLYLDYIVCKLSATTDDEYHQDILLNLLFDLLKNFKTSLPTELTTKVTNALKELHGMTANKKMVFMLEDMIKLLAA